MDCGEEMPMKALEALDEFNKWVAREDNHLSAHIQTIRKALQAMEWQPIETFPRDADEDFLLAWGGMVCEGFYDDRDDYWCLLTPFIHETRRLSFKYTPTKKEPKYWMPLPPKGEEHE
jgi:hypothetical protein